MWFIIVVTSILLILIHWVYKEFFGYWKKREVPHPRTLPLFGNLAPSTTVMSLATRLHNIYSNFKDCLYVGYYQFQKPVIIIRDVKLSRTIMIKEFASFHDNHFHINANGDEIFAKNPFVAKGEVWKAAKIQSAAGVTNDKVKNMFNVMRIVNKNLIEILNEEIKNDKPIDAKELCARYSSDILALCLLGFEGNALNNPNSEYRNMTRNLSRSTFWIRLKNYILFTHPPLGYILRFSFIPKDVSKYFNTIFESLIKYREMNHIFRNDYLDLMISFKSKLELTDNDVIARAMTLLIGNVEAISVVLSVILYEIGQNWEIQSKLQEEIDETMEKCNGVITYEELHNMHYLDMVLSESLRKNPPIMFVSRTCTKEFTLPPAKGEDTGPNVTLEIGTPIIIPIYPIHMDPTYYPEPEKFIPERFSEEAKRSRQKYTYLPFGNGPRMCLGSRLAVTEIKLAIISILANFNIKLNSKTAPGFEIDMPYIFAIKKGKIWLNFDKRTH